MSNTGLLILVIREKRCHLLSQLVGSVLWFIYTYINVHCCSVFHTEENKAKEICLELGADRYVIGLHTHRFLHHQSQKVLPSINEFSCYYKE